MPASCNPATFSPPACGMAPPLVKYNKNKKNMAEKKTYEEAMKRLENIVYEIEHGEIDIDSLSEKLKEAQTLLAFCRDKLSKVNTEIQKLLEAESASTEK
jgi:exodeoxyribonuclease VII small subunit